MDREIQERIRAKFDMGKASEAAAWLEQLTEREVDPADLVGSLKSGVVLCKALNKIKRKTVKKINKSSMAFKERENIVNYLEGCKQLGMKEIDNFVTQDLYEGDNLTLVVNQIFTLAMLAERVPGFEGPYLGTARLATENKRQFSEETIREGKNFVPLQNQGSVAVKKSVGVDKIIQYANVDEKMVHSSEPSQQTMGSVTTEKEIRTDAIDRYGFVRKRGSQIKHSNVPSQQTAGSVAVPKQDHLDQIIQQPMSQSRAAANVPKFCPECGTETGTGRFCAECGEKLY